MNNHIVRWSSVGLLFIIFIWACQKATSRDAGGAPHSADTSLLARHAFSKGDTGVCIGNSIISGHPWKHSGLELNDLTRPDSPGQISYQLAQLTKFPWYNHGIGGQTTVDIRKRFLRDAIGLTEDPHDYRGTRTLPGTPGYVVLEGGVNDIQNGIPLDTIKNNIVWMASTCKQYKVHCIVLNCVSIGDGVFQKPQADEVSELNTWLAAGALDSVHAIIIDINSLWNSGAYGGVSRYGNDNLHYSSLVADDVHFYPAGYDSVANAIFRVAKLPIDIGGH